MVKSIFVLCLLTCSVSIFAFTNGTYAVQAGNNDSICPQEIKVKNSGRQLEVVYVGDCFYWGPFTYDCQDKICGDENIQFEYKDDNHYRWQNLVYNIWGDFYKITP